MFTVVEDQQGGFRTQVVLEDFEVCAMRILTEFQDGKQCLHDERRIGKWSEFDEPDPTGEHGEQICSHLESKTGLSRAARACQRDHPMFRDQLPYFIDL